MVRTRNPGGDRCDYLRLDKNENIVGVPDELLDLLRRQITPEFISAYPEVDGLYQKIAWKCGVKPENIYLTAGSDAGIKAAFEVFVEKNDSVLLLDPTYAMFYVYISMFEALPVLVGYREDLSLTATDVIAAIEANHPKLICVANPNSPTGTIIPPAGIEKIIEKAAEFNSVVLIDEAYYPFYPVSALPLVDRYPHMIITRTFSKAEGLASARLGYVIGQTEIISELHKVRPMYETNAFAIRFAEVLMDNYQVVEKNVQTILKGRAWLEQALSDRQIPFFRSEANFMNISVGTYEKTVFIAEALKRDKILIKSGLQNTPLEKCIRVSLGAPEQMRLFMDAFEKAYKAQ